MATQPKKARSKPPKKQSATLDHVSEYRHEEATRKNNPPAKIAAEGVVPSMAKVRYEYSPRLAPALRFDPTGAPDKLPELLAEAKKRPLSDDELKMLAGALRTQDPWLEWANKREKRHFEVDPVALHIHERVSPQAILRVAARRDIEPSLFGDPQQQYHEAVQFYRHEIPWTNRLILGDSLQVMTSLSHREDLAGKVQMIYMDPPYGIKFGSNFQPEVGNRDVKDKEQDLTREAETVKAYRDTWHLGIHSYLSYLRDRLVVAKELLTDAGSMFLQIGDENLHRVRVLLDEVFGAENCVSVITFRTTSSLGGNYLGQSANYLLWYARKISILKYRQTYKGRGFDDDIGGRFSRVELPAGVRRVLTTDERNDIGLIPERGEIYRHDNLTSQSGGDQSRFPVDFHGQVFNLVRGHWKTNPAGMARLEGSDRLAAPTQNSLTYIRFINDFPFTPYSEVWTDTQTGAFTDEKRYVVQTNTKVIERCLLMATDPGDLVLDPTCGNGTTAYVAEQWGRRWITADTSRVSIAIARQRLMTAKYEMYELRDEDAGVAANFKYKTVPHVTLKSIAQNTNLDPIFAKHKPHLDNTLAQCNEALKQASDTVRIRRKDKLLRKQREHGRKAITDADRRRWELLDQGKPWEHWQVPFDTDPDWPVALSDGVTAYRKAWRARMEEVNACITANAEQEELVDQPKVVRSVVRVSGPFTVEAVQPPEMSLGETHVVRDESKFAGAPEGLETFTPVAVTGVETRLDQEAQNVEAYLDQMIRLIKLDGVRFPNNKEMKFSRLEPVLDGSVIHAEGRWSNGEKDKDPEGKANVGVVFGPQYGPVTAMQVEEAIRQANRRGYDHLVLAGFSFDGASQTVIAEATQFPSALRHKGLIELL